MRIKDAKKVVFLRVGALGDLLVGLSAFTETLEMFPNADVFLVGNSLWLEIIEPGFFSRLRGLLILDDSKSNRGYVYLPISKKWMRQDEKVSLKNFFQDTDVLVNTRLDSLRFAWPAFFAGVKTRFGSAAFPFQWLYTERAPWLGKDPLIHERDAALRIIDPSNGLITKWQSRGGLPSTRKYQPVKWKEYFLINPTASREVKAWPKEKFRLLVEKLSSQNLKLIGSTKESAWLEFVANGNAEIIQPSNIGELMDIVAGAKFLVTNTSSMQFIAASTQTPTLTLMGNAKREVWGPLGKNDKVIMGKFQNFQGDQDAKEIAAFQSISVEEVFSAVRSFL